MKKLIILFFCLFCQSKPSSQPLDDYSIYSQVITEYFQAKNKKYERLVFNKNTSNQSYEYDEKAFADLSFLRLLSDNFVDISESNSAVADTLAIRLCKKLDSISQ
jgi:hypothetical protein